MTERDKVKYERLISTVKRNFRITRIYAEYLNHYPELITKEMVDILTEDGVTIPEVAISALLSESLGLEFENDEDRRILMDYFTPSIRLLDSKKYENNPYYKNIRLDDLKSGNWEIKCYFRASNADALKRKACR